MSITVEKPEIVAPEIFNIVSSNAVCATSS